MGRKPRLVTHVAANITDFSTAVGADAAVAANTAKVTNATHTGDVTGNGALTITAGAVTATKQSNVDAGSIIGRATAGIGSQEVLTPTQARGVLGVREVLSTTRNYYVDVGLGSDANSGLAAGAGNAFATIQHAMDVALGIDNSTYAIYINIAAGTYAENIVMARGLVGGGRLVLVGVIATPTNVSLAPIGGNILTVTSGALDVRGVSFDGGVRGIKVEGPTAFVALKSVNFSGGVSNAHIEVSANAWVIIEGNYTITGAANNHYYVRDGGVVNGYNFTITLTGTMSFANAFAKISTTSAANLSAMTYDVTGATVSGTRYVIEMNAACKTAGGGASYLPGSVAGYTATGGQYA